MNNSDNMDLDSLVNNPFQFVSPQKTPVSNKPKAPDKPIIPEKQEAKDTAPVEGNILPGPEKPHVPLPVQHVPADINIDRVNKNHPLEIRFLNLEKNQLNWDQKIGMLKEIIERQNERLELMEKELDMLYKKINK
ncbi:hypothetical protein LLG96_03760 [bacterium]|nr:hypothetical protein [bacterium]